MKQVQTLKNIHNLKAERYVLFKFLGLKTQEAALQVTPREPLQGGEEGEPGYIAVLQQGR